MRPFHRRLNQLYVELNQMPTLGYHQNGAVQLEQQVQGPVTMDHALSYHDKKGKRAMSRLAARKVFNLRECMCEQHTRILWALGH